MDEFTTRILLAYGGCVRDGRVDSVPHLLREHSSEFETALGALCPQDWQSYPFINEVISIDLETTGFSPTNDSIFEIGAVSSHGHVFQRLIKVQVPHHIQILTHVTQEEVDLKGVSLKEACDAFYAWLKERNPDAVWAGHRITSFDLPFLLNAFKKCGYKKPVVPSRCLFVDTHSWVKELKLKKKALGDVYSLALGESITGAHRATTDADAVLRILFSRWAGLRWWPEAVKPLTRKRKGFARGAFFIC